MNTTETENVVNQMSTLAVESTQTLVDAAYLAQRQSAELIQAWLNTLNTNQQAQREIAARLVQQAQEAQTLLQQYVRESVRGSADTMTRATQAGLNQAGEAFNTAAQQTEQAAQQSTGGTKRPGESGHEKK